MNFMSPLHTRVAIAVIALLWINVGSMLLRFWWGMEANPVIVLGGGVAIAAAATLTWWRDRTGTATRISTALAHAASVALLIYSFSGSPLQNDMHVYFFASLAICAAWVDWRPVVAFAALAALHYIVLFLLIPTAIFPGDTDFGRIALHAGILVLEAAVLVAMGHLLTVAFANTQKTMTRARTANLSRAATNLTPGVPAQAEQARAQAPNAAATQHREAEQAQDDQRLQFAINSLDRILDEWRAATSASGTESAPPPRRSAG